LCAELRSGAVPLEECADVSLPAVTQRDLRRNFHQ
jgi:hypothetical protein